MLGQAAAGGAGPAPAVADRLGAARWPPATTPCGPVSPRRASRWPSTPGSAGYLAVRETSGDAGREASRSGLHAACPLVPSATDLGRDRRLVCHGVLERHPPCASPPSRTGAMWVPVLREAWQTPARCRAFASTPSSSSAATSGSPLLRGRHGPAQDLLGVDRLLFGSDFPHTEGLPEPCVREGHPHLHRPGDPQDHAGQRARPAGVTPHEVDPTGAPRGVTDRPTHSSASSAASTLGSSTRP